LHIIWAQQLFKKGSVLLSGQDEIKVIKPGIRNSNAGPDFGQAKIHMSGLEWIGAIEIHVRASEWNDHNHQRDASYQAVILHVVWENDKEVYRLDGSLVPCLEIKNMVEFEVVLKYRSLLSSEKKAIRCATFLPHIQPFVIIGMQERVLVERLERKANDILTRLESNQNDWIETFFQTIAWCLGLQVNAEPMLVLSQSIPVKILAGQGWNPDKMSAILLGQAGFLEDPKGPASEKLKTEYQFIQNKYGISGPPLLWKLFRLRPGSFPKQRLALLATIISNLPAWFDMLTEVSNPDDFFRKIENSKKSELLTTYLQENGFEKFDFKITDFIRNNLVINVFSPFLTAFSLYKNQKEWIEKALDWLSATKSEQNAIIKAWNENNIKSNSAAESQALNELYKKYCCEKRCMECQVGTSVLKLK